MIKNITIEEIRNDIRKFVLDNYLFGYEDKELGDDLSFLNMGVLDSTGIIELVVFLEEKYAFEVLDEEIIPENLDSINCISKYVNTKLNVGVKE